MRPLRIVSVAAANAAVFGLYLMFMGMIGKNESILPAMIVPTVLFIAAAVIFKAKLVHILPAYAAVIGYAVWGAFSGHFELSTTMLILFTGLFVILQLTALLISNIVRSGIRSICEEIGGGKSD